MAVSPFLSKLARLPADSMAGKLVRLPLRLMPRSRVTQIRGGLNQGAKWLVGAHTNGCWLGIYEPEMQATASRVIRPGMVVWDVGANAGFYTLAFSRLVGPQGHVYSFEPLANNVARLLDHVRLNACRNVEVVQVAMGAQSGLESFRIGLTFSMGRLSGDSTGYRVPVHSADEFIARYPHARPDALKVDIEGAEVAFMAGAANLLRQPALSILLSLHGESLAKSCRETLTANGFTFFHIDGTPLRDWTYHEGEVLAHKGAPLP